MSSALELRGVSMVYGRLRAVSDVSVDVQDGARHALIGPNGAGKSTLFGIVSGDRRPTEGRIAYFGEEIAQQSQIRRARRGLVQTFQHSRLFLSLTIAENVAIAAQRGRAGLRGLWRPGWRPDVHAAVIDCLTAAGLADFDRRASELSHGERRQLEVAVALAARPRILLLDEPTAGMSPLETDRFVSLIEAMPPDITILIIEHDLSVVFRLATHVTVMHLGEVVVTGPPEVVRADEEVQRAYLGAVAHDQRGAGDR